MSDENYWIPRTLDDPALYLFFESDTATVFLVSFFAVISFSFLAAIAVGFLVARVFVQLKENGDKGLITQMCYWYTPSDIWLSPFWVSSVREYSGR